MEYSCFLFGQIQKTLLTEKGKKQKESIIEFLCF